MRFVKRLIELAFIILIISLFMKNKDLEFQISLFRAFRADQNGFLGIGDHFASPSELLLPRWVIWLRN